jgi:transketolase
MRDAFVGRLTDLADADPRIMLITGDLGFGVLTKFAQRFPRQFINAGVAEQNMMGLATGLAMEGHIVFTYSIANFGTLRCLEQIRNDAAYHDANVKVVAVGGGFSYGALGVSHHATEDLAILRAVPGVTVVAPNDDWEAAEATAALVRRPGTAYLRLDRSSVAGTPAQHEEFSLGTARTVREGQAATIITTGGMLAEALAAHDTLSREGLITRVVSLHTLTPIDTAAILDACRATGGIVTVEEHSVVGGLGSAVAEVCADASLFPRAFRRIGLRAGFSSIVGGQQYLRTRYGIDSAAIVEAVRSMSS